MLSENKAFRALIAQHKGHGEFVGYNFIDCASCHFHAHASSRDTAVEHDGGYSFVRTYGVRDDKLVVLEERFSAGERTPTYGELLEALRAANPECKGLLGSATGRSEGALAGEIRG